MKKASEIDINAIDTQSTEFQNALTLIKYTSQSLFLTGKAGTGKSTFLRYLTNTTKKKFVVLAPTGIAAVNAGGQTIHSFFKIPFKPILPDDPDFSDSSRLRERMKYSKQFVKMLKSLELIIIDEVSMVRADTIDFVDRLLRVFCGNNRQPFAGKQLLLVGDVFQLEPVITGDMKDVLGYYYKEGSYFFNAKAFENLPLVPIELTKVYRQKDKLFIELLDRVRIGNPLPKDIDLLNAKVIKGPQLFTEDFVITIATRRDIVDSINQNRLDTLPTPSHSFIGTTEGDFPENSLPTDKELVLKEDAQVVFVKNDMDRRWVNGSLGKITGFNEDEIIVETEDGTKHSVQQEIWQNIKYEYDEETKKVKEIVIGEFKQYPLKLAWALTIHKSQGLTFDNVIVDVGAGAFSGGQSYVALSRCRSLEGLKLRSTINSRDIFVNNKIVKFSKSFNSQSLISNALNLARADELYANSAQCFEKGDISRAVDLFAEASTYRNELNSPNVVRLIKAKLCALTKYSKKVAELEKEIEENRRMFLKLATEFVELGEACRNEGWDMQSAIANYDKAISLSPNYSYAWLCKGLANAQLGNYDEAIMCLDKAAEIDKGDFRALYEAGVIIISNGDLALGMDYLLRALERNPKAPIIHLALADGYDQINDLESADYHRKMAEKLKKTRRPDT